MVIDTVDQERAWWDEIAAGPDLVGNIYDESIGTAEDCLAEILPALDLGPEPAVLDLGCGTGRLLGAFIQAIPGAWLTGVDISDRILDHARAREDLRNVQFWVCDGRTIPPVADGFHAVYSMGLFQHLPADACAGYVREVARVLWPGGRFRFQSVLGDEDAFLSHQTTASAMVSWCSAAGLIVDECEGSRLKAEWLWVTARKP